MSNGSRLIGLATGDLCGFLRGRFVAEADLSAAVERGVGWVPANIALTSFGTIATPNAFGSVGDLCLRVDASTRRRAEFGADATPFELILCDQVEPDGAEWDCCPRTFARNALARLHERTGLRLRASFEFEFQLRGCSPAPPFSVEALRCVDPFGSVVHDALVQVGCEPEVVIPEYGHAQFEVPCAPAVGLDAADRAAVFRAVAREAARVCGQNATFTPILEPDAVGNGAHVHFSLVDDLGRSVTGEAEGAGGLARVALQFAAGMLEHARALCAVLAPLPISYLRLRPGHWSSAAPLLRVRDREAFLRICPAAEDGDTHLELRATDASCSPYLVLGMLALAGLAGIDSGLPAPALAAVDGETVAEGLPATLSEALAALEDDPVARGWMPPRLLETYLAVKRAEIKAVEGLDDAEACARYADVY